METEFEATYINIDKDKFRQILKKAGAKLRKPEFMQRRIVADLPKGHKIKGGWLRVRDEGDKITLTLKIVNGDKIESQKEITLVVDNFEKADLLLKTIGCKINAYQESKRELWLLDGVEITIDEWPFLEPYVEVEGKSKKEVVRASQKLGFNFDEALFCSVDKIYALRYGISEEVITKQTPGLKFTGSNPFSKLSEKN